MLSRFIKSAGTKETHAFIEPHESRQNRTAHKMVIPDHYKTDAHCDTERDKQCVQHADRTGNIVLVGEKSVGRLDTVISASPADTFASATFTV